MTRTNGGQAQLDATVIIPAKNAALTVAEQLEALSGQTFEGKWEVIVADNGSTDETVEIVERFSHRLPLLRVIDASAIAGSSHARNRAAHAASGKLLCFCDADDVVDPEWLAELVKAGEQFEIAGGSLETKTLNDPIVRSWRPAPNAARAVDSIDFAPTSNMVVNAGLFHELGGFNEEYVKSHDVEFSRRVVESGRQIIFWPAAIVSYRLRSDLRGVAHQAFRGGRAAAQACADGRRPPRSLADSATDWLWLALRLPTLISRRRRGIWVRRTAEAAGRLVGSIRWRVLYL